LPRGFSHDDWAVFGGAAGNYTPIICFLLRRGMPRDLRKRLIRAGVPVCIRRGYALRGLPADRRRCPACGRRLSPAVRTLLGEPGVCADGS
jgi:hypothetical protein